MAAPSLLTYRDALDHTVNFLSGRQSASMDLRRSAVHEAYREVAVASDWTFLIKQGRIVAEVPQITGTVAYDHTGGTYERQLTLTGATWPANVIDYSIRIDDVVCDIEERKSDTVVTLSPTMNPGADVAAGETYSLYRRWYVLPSDFDHMIQPGDENYFNLGKYLAPSEWMMLNRHQDTSGQLTFYTIIGVPDLIGTLGLFVHPLRETVGPIDFIYKRKPRTLRYSGNTASDHGGTITLTQGSAIVVGVGTAFASAMAGSVLRTAGNSTAPTGLTGGNPWIEERVILSVTDSTHLTLDNVAASSLSGVAYMISDPIDLGPETWSYFYRCIEKHMALMLGMDDAGGFVMLAEEERLRAKAGDNRVRERRVAGSMTRTYRRLADMPITLGISE